MKGPLLERAFVVTYRVVLHA